MGKGDDPTQIVLPISGVYHTVWYSMPNTTTKRGNETQQRIVQAAATLIHHHGAKATSVDEILSASDTGKSQFYHYFDSKDALIEEVLSLCVQRSLDFTELSLAANPDPVKCLAALFDGAVEHYSSIGCEHGCPVASLALELGGTVGPVRNTISSFYQDFQTLITSKLNDLQTNGQLGSSNNIDDLAQFISATFHGSLLLATVQGTTKPISTAKGVVLDHIRGLANN